MWREWVMVGHGTRTRGSDQACWNCSEGGKIVLSKSRRGRERKDVWRSELKREK